MRDLLLCLSLVALCLSSASWPQYAAADAATAADAAPAAGAIEVPESAYGSAVFSGDVPQLEARLLLHPDDVGGQRRLGLLFELAPGWHLYWRNPGHSGLPTELDWQVDGASVGAVAWPAPKAFRESDGLITTYGYEGRVLLAAEAHFAEVPGSNAEARVEAKVLACNVECVPAKFTLSRPWVAAVDQTNQVRTLFRETAADLPVDPQAAGLRVDVQYSQSALRPGDEFAAAIAVRPCGVADHCEHAPFRAAGADFFPDLVPGVRLDPGLVVPDPAHADGLLIELAGKARSADPGGDQRLRGVLTLRAGSGESQHLDVDLPLPRAPAGAEVAQLGTPWLDAPSIEGATGDPGVGLAHALLLAFIGGLILNLMPCVLPVLAIKVVSATELASKSRAAVVAHGLAYTGGILVTMLALAAAVSVLRAAGASVGWGFQFQEPLFVAAISTVLLIFALNLFGVFEISLNAGSLATLGQEASGPSRSFFEGLLAVVLATPCSAPFLGTAVGFAFASPVPVIVAIFAAVGLGLASPFVLVTLIPGWARLVPRPGAWMLRLRTGLGFALMGTVVWLLWVLGRSVGVDGLVTLLVFLLAVAFGTWVYGSVQLSGHAGLKLGVGGAVLVLGLAGLSTVGFEAREPEPSAELYEERPFDRAAIRAELREGKTVFVYFTADWCITCAANERLVLANPRVREQLGDAQVEVFKGDWTLRDEDIRAELARFGKAGVPLYLVYHPDAPEMPKVLPELLSVDLVLDSLRSSTLRADGSD